MAEHITGRFRRQPRRSQGLTKDEIAAALVPRRDRLVAQLPRELAVARGLTADQAELVVDEAIDFLVTQYTVPIHAPDELERAFWAAAAIRAKRTHDGRNATVRAGWTRVDIERQDVPTLDSEPEAAALEQSEMEALLEFAATLTELERQVLSYRYGVVGRPPGAVVISRELGLAIGEVRSAELSLHHKLTQFIAIVSAGNLCRHRSPLVAALAVGGLSEEAARLARAHLAHCPACRLEHAARLRDLRSGKLPRDIASILPVPPAVESARQPRAVWDALTDWASRPFSHEATVTGSQIGTAGRGLGGLAAAKLATLCIGGATLVGGSLYCVTSTDILRPKPPAPRTQARTAPARTTPKQSGPKEDLSYLKARPTPTPSPRPKLRATPTQTPSPRATVFSANHERAGAISPAPAGSAPGGATEFGPGPAQSSTQPAPPAAGGGTEFP